MTPDWKAIRKSYLFALGVSEDFANGFASVVFPVALDELAGGSAGHVNEESQLLPFEEAVDVAVRTTGMFEIAEGPWPEGLEQFASDEPVPQALKEKLFEDGREMMRKVLRAVGYPSAPGPGTAAKPPRVHRPDLMVHLEGRTLKPTDADQGSPKVGKSLGGYQGGAIDRSKPVPRPTSAGANVNVASVSDVTTDTDPLAGLSITGRLIVNDLFRQSRDLATAHERLDIYAVPPGSIEERLEWWFEQQSETLDQLIKAKSADSASNLSDESSLTIDVLAKAYHIAAKVHEVVQNTERLDIIDGWDVADWFTVVKSALATDGEA